MHARVPVLVVTGPVGVGKTTVTLALGDLLAAAGLPHTLVDMDWLRSTWPAPRDDRFHTGLGYRALAALAREARAAGSGRFVIADVVETWAQRDEYARAIPGAEVTVARLLADLGTIEARIARRAAGADDPWEPRRAAELIGIMDANAVADLTIDTTGLAPMEIAREIAARLAWLSDEGRRDGG